ncbi:hypothetical protein [Rudanella lutea]|uniref:hypothetical protein n=1 Tax=Rudanella lutea TaxID=451374 RepID=UPI00035ED6B3|nr:hypothetical protein [Rudanella lutea]
METPKPVPAHSEPNYDPVTRVYTILGMRFHADVFQLLHDAAKKGQKFRLIEADGEICTLEQLPD